MNCGNLSFLYTKHRSPEREVICLEVTELESGAGLSTLRPLGSHTLVLILSYSLTDAGQVRI